MNSMNAMLHSFTRIDEELFEELEEILIMGDVGAATAGRICEELRRKVKERGETDPKLLKNGEAPVCMRITVNGCMVDISIKRSCPVNLRNRAKENSKAKTVCQWN